MSAKRYVVAVYLDSFVSESCGDVFGEGEFYFTVNKSRFPDKGYIKLGANEKFDPEPDPCMFFQLKETKADKVKLKIQVWEQDPGVDDKFMDETIIHPLEDGIKKYTIKNKKETCKLKIWVNIKKTKKW